eukprot:6274215-Pyramimonas_sp.AAC.1
MAKGRRRLYISSASAVSQRSLDTDKDKNLHTIQSINDILDQKPVRIIWLSLPVLYVLVHIIMQHESCNNIRVYARDRVCSSKAPSV